MPCDKATAQRLAGLHARAVTTQGMAGLRRTLPVWWVGAFAVGTVTAKLRGVPRPPRRHTTVTALVAQAAWIGGYASFSYLRTYQRMTSNTSPDINAFELCKVSDTDVADGVRSEPVTVSAATKVLTDSAWYLDGIFAWPRQSGGGTWVLEHMLTEADKQGRDVFLNTMSPRAARLYKRHGFTYQAWMYWMHRATQNRTPSVRR